jgi:hypothetical protein
MMEGEQIHCTNSKMKPPGNFHGYLWLAGLILSPFLADLTEDSVRWCGGKGMAG